mgnify:CR=1 FL=1
MGLFSIGEALHQLGFIAAKDNSSLKAIDYYNESLKSRQKLFKLTVAASLSTRWVSAILAKETLTLSPSKNSMGSSELMLKISSYLGLIALS